MFVGSLDSILSPHRNRINSGFKYDTPYYINNNAYSTPPIRPLPSDDVKTMQENGPLKGTGIINTQAMNGEYNKNDYGYNIPNMFSNSDSNNNGFDYVKYMQFQQMMYHIFIQMTNNQNNNINNNNTNNNSNNNNNKKSWLPPPPYPMNISPSNKTKSNKLITPKIEYNINSEFGSSLPGIPSPPQPTINPNKHKTGKNTINNNNKDNNDINDGIIDEPTLLKYNKINSQSVARDDNIHDSDNENNNIINNDIMTDEVMIVNDINDDDDDTTEYEHENDVDNDSDYNNNKSVFISIRNGSQIKDKKDVLYNTSNNENSNSLSDIDLEQYNVKQHKLLKNKKRRSQSDILNGNLKNYLTQIRFHDMRPNPPPGMPPSKTYSNLPLNTVTIDDFTSKNGNISNDEDTMDTSSVSIITSTLMSSLHRRLYGTKRTKSDHDIKTNNLQQSLTNRVSSTNNDTVKIHTSKSSFNLDDSDDDSTIYSVTNETDPINLRNIVNNIVSMATIEEKDINDNDNNKDYGM